MRRFSSIVLWLAWLLNAAAFVGVVAWIVRDGRFPESAHALGAEVSAWFGSGTAPRLGASIATRATVLATIGATAVGSGMGVFVGLFAGPPRHRRIRSWLAFTLFVAAWLALFASWPALAWHAQGWRLAGELDGFDLLAGDLRTHWPADDGDRPDIGPFMAYPKGNAQTLILLTTPTVPQSGTSLSAIEGSAAGPLRFELTGNEQGAWVEWHPEGSTPESFVGGLMSEYELDRYLPLGGGWYLVRYQEVRANGPSA